ncbi:MAG: hypothetical protein HUJ98_12750 [Bacteroidaceae bacterium]|nr:hypothetical protein [Bacteroidaceae bacterium]
MLNPIIRQIEVDILKRTMRDNQPIGNELVQLLDGFDFMVIGNHGTLFLLQI